MSKTLGPETVGTKVTRLMDAVDSLLVLLAQALLVSMVLLTFISVCGRTFLNTSVPDDLFINEMLMVAIVFLPLGYVQSVGAHLEVTVLSDLLPAKMQSLLVSLGLILGIAAFGLMAYVGWLNAYEDYLSGAYGWSSVLYLPLWPAKMMIPLGLGWWCLRMLVQLTLPGARVEKADTELHQALEAAQDADNNRPVRSTRDQL